MKSIEELEVEIRGIKERNNRVELDKAWETSWIRKIIISIFTYIVIAIFFFFAKLENPLVNAIVPAMAFILSTLSMSLFKKWWIENIKNN